MAAKLGYVSSKIGIPAEHGFLQVSNEIITIAVPSVLTVSFNLLSSFLITRAASLFMVGTKSSSEYEL